MGEPISMSPSARQRPRSGTEMNFAQALSAVADGAKVTKIEWADPSVFLTLGPDERVMIMNGTFHDNRLHPFVMQLGDIVGTDWMMVETR